MSSDPDELARRVADARPELDPTVRSVGYARVAAALFGEAEAVTVGRYRLERQLGRGGSGVVFVAHDPELHRDVAVKLIRCTSERHRERALAEARALAKLSHPNIVPVHDVGATDDHVYLVMELLRGQSLREYAVGRSAREIVGAYRQVAAGLAAAHAAGIVHRDVKPDNAMLGDDGRLRVVDFGLAAEDVTGGTPGYMSPEQRAGDNVEAATDQYALATSLGEALGSPPAWLARVIARATAEAPADRYPSMHALERALADDPRTRWTRRTLFAAPVVLAVAGFAIGARVTGGDEPCSGGAELLAGAWTPQRGAELAQRIAQLGTPYALSASGEVRTRTAALGAAWLSAHGSSCTAHSRRELTDELYDRATVCLARSRVGFGDALQLLARAQPTELAPAIQALAAVERPERCADPIALAAEAAPQVAPVARAIEAQIERAAFHARAASAQAVPLATAAVQAARTSGDPQLVAHALLVQGHAAMNNDVAAAIPPLHEAMLVAVAAGRDDLATEAYARHAWVAAQKRQPGALDGVELATAIGKRAADRGAFARALLANNVGAAAEIAGDFARARDAFREAILESATVRGPDAIELVIARSNLGMLTADLDERRALFDGARQAVTAALGADHPQALTRQLQAISDERDPHTVIAALAPLCRRVARLHPHLTFLVDICAFEVAWQAAAIGDTTVLAEAVALASPPSATPSRWRRLLDAYADVAKRRRSPERMAELAELTATDPTWHGQVYAADAHLAIAALSGDARAAAAAEERLARAVAIVGVDPGFVQRRRAWAQALRIRR